MTTADFEEAVKARRPLPESAPALIRALWHDATGDWDSAHKLAQDVDSGDGAWVHAYLHRREGDIGNAHYWYRRAGRQPGDGSLDQERAAIVAALLSG